MKAFVLLTSLWLALVPAAFAKKAQNGVKPVHATVKLVAIKALKTMENEGDELYFSVLKFPSEGRPSVDKIPEHPKYWPSEHLDKVINVTLWNNKLKKDEAITLVFALVDQDTPPWNTDDIVGSVRLQLKNANGKLEASWSVPNRAEPPVIVNTKYGEAKRFSLMNKDAHYELFFTLEEK